MNARIIACRTLEKELLAAMENTGCRYPIHWLEAGQHNRKDARRAEIQEALDGCSGCDTVLLAMTLCGGCAEGIQSHGFQLVVPRCEDCITLLLGSKERRRDFPGTYFLTDGWLSGAENIRNEYVRTLEKYGQSRARRIFSSMLANYEYLSFLDTGCADASTEIQNLAALLDLSYTRMEGTLTYLEDLLRGNWEEDRFVILEPHRTLTFSE